MPDLMKNQNMQADLKSAVAISVNIYETFLSVLLHKSQVTTAHKILYCLVNPELFSFPKIFPFHNIIFSINMKDLQCLFGFVVWVILF